MTKPQDPYSIPSKRESYFARFKKVLFQFIKPWHHQTGTDVQLAQEVQRNADEILAQLRAIKDDLKHSVDGKLFTHVEDVVDPIAARIKSVTQRLGTEKEHVEEFDQWMNKKVRPLVEAFGSRTDDKKIIEAAVLKHAIEVCTKQIDTDLKVINDDIQHKVINLLINEDEHKILEFHVYEALKPVLLEWEQLKIPPKKLTLESLGKWKSGVDAKRTHYYHVAMEIIDSIVPETGESEEVHESLLQNFKEIEELEESIPQLIYEIEEGELINHNLVRLQKHFDELEHRVLQLELDLRLTPELFERLQLIKKGLSRVSTRLLNAKD